MEDKSLDNMLQSFNKKEDDTWLMNVMQLNMDCIITIQTQKAKSKLTRVAIIKIIAVVLGLVWVWFLGSLCFAAYMTSNMFFLVSSGAIMFFTVAAIIVYLKHLVLIGQIKNSYSIVYTQQQLAELQTSTLKITRILFLQTPFYSTWFLTPTLLANTSMGWIIFILATLGWHIGMYGMFKKAGIEGWKAFIPFYNTWCMVQKMELKKYWFFLQFIPIAGQFITIWITIKFVEHFGRFGFWHHAAAAQFAKHGGWAVARRCCAAY